MAATVFEVSAEEAASQGIDRMWINVKNILSVHTSPTGTGDWNCVVNLGAAGVSSVLSSQSAAEARAAVWTQRIEDAK